MRWEAWRWFHRVSKAKAVRLPRGNVHGKGCQWHVCGYFILPPFCKVLNSSEGVLMDKIDFTCYSDWSPWRRPKRVVHSLIGKMFILLIFYAFFESGASVLFMGEVFVLQLGINWNKASHASDLPPSNNVCLLNVGDESIQDLVCWCALHWASVILEATGWYLPGVDERPVTDWLYF